MSWERGWDTWASTRPWMLIINESDDESFFISPRYFTSEVDAKAAVENERVRLYIKQLFYVPDKPQVYETVTVHNWVIHE